MPHARASRKATTARRIGLRRSRLACATRRDRVERCARARELASSAAALLSIAEEDNRQARHQQYILIKQAFRFREAFTDTSECGRCGDGGRCRFWFRACAFRPIDRIVFARQFDESQSLLFLISEVNSAVCFAGPHGAVCASSMTGSFLAMT